MKCSHCIGIRTWLHRVVATLVPNAHLHRQYSEHHSITSITQQLLASASFTMFANQHDWHSSISAIDRYNRIRSIQESLPDGSMSTATRIEQAAYHNSKSLDEYSTACAQAVTAVSSSTTEAVQDQDTSSTVTDGTTIGSYTNCTPIADGVTSTVYRSSDGQTALKVITTHQPLPPHSPSREIAILRTLHPPCIPLLDAFRDQHQYQVLAFPYKPLTLETLLLKTQPNPLSTHQAKSIFADVLRALADIHAAGIIHRDIKPSAILLDSPTGPAYLADFGTAWHPRLSASEEPAADGKILDIGTGAYRAPEVLFAHKAYGTGVDMWACGVMLAECLSAPARPPFESRPAHEDGNQLGLILSVLKTMGSPTRETWPEAAAFKVSPFEMWNVFPQREWAEILPDVDPAWRDMIASTVRYSKRATAEELLQSKCFQNV